MSLTFVEPQTDSEWDSLVKSFTSYSFLNSSFRFHHEKNYDPKAFRFVIKQDVQTIGILVGSFGSTKLFGKFLEFKHSPLLLNESKENWIDIFSFCKELAKNENCFMYRVAPLVEKNTLLSSIYDELGFVKAPIQNIDALISQYFDLRKSEDELRHDMTDSTRNNLNKLMKNPDVSVKIFNDDSQFDLFNSFYIQTEMKKGFVGKSIESLFDEFRKQIESNSFYMIVGYFKGIPVSIWQCTVFGKYIHIYQAGSDSEFREKNIRMPYILFWESVKLGKSLNCEVLDLFGGMLPEGYAGKRHPWIGVNNFKESFGGKKITYMHLMDYPVKKVVYRVFYIYAYLRTVMKGYTVKW
ncbi:peptidoglycan bridge formation glycyltransferase FemA/FemB family protein [Candidatus Microgenomates bacterium]|nr:peptidoglycan bridge formation glycyltransferase FemA/FemB family protein [Candidatus Microgenomates bacterium]